MARAAQQIDDGAGFLTKRRRAIRAAGIVAIGPSAPPGPPPKPDGSARIRAQRARTAADRAHEGTVRAELMSIDGRLAEIAQRLASLDARPRGAVGPGPDLRSFEAQELAAERRQLAELRGEVERDVLIEVDRDGRPLTDRDRAFVRVRAGELAENLWAASQRSAATGDHRAARRQRVDAIRSRMIAEYEMHWRRSLPGYSSPWS